MCTGVKKSNGQAVDLECPTLWGRGCKVWWPQAGMTSGGSLLCLCGRSHSHGVLTSMPWRCRDTLSLMWAQFYDPGQPVVIVHCEGLLILQNRGHLRLRWDTGIFNPKWGLVAELEGVKVSTGPSWCGRSMLLVCRPRSHWDVLSLEVLHSTGSLWRPRLMLKT